MKPRIVREYVGINHAGFLGEMCSSGAPYLVIPWPKVGTGPGECPYTPEQVMAACERDGCILVGVPRYDHAGWFILTDKRPYSLTPDFIGEPKRCEPEAVLCNCGHRKGGGPWYSCPRCGGFTRDRRKEQQRKGERRSAMVPFWGGRRSYDIKYREFANRRSGRDRRQAP